MRSPRWRPHGRTEGQKGSATVPGADIGVHIGLPWWGPARRRSTPMGENNSRRTAARKSWLSACALAPPDSNALCAIHPKSDGTSGAPRIRAPSRHRPRRLQVLRGRHQLLILTQDATRWQRAQSAWKDRIAHLKQNSLVDEFGVQPQAQRYRRPPRPRHALA